jgi:hypothetical protein
LGFRVQAPVDVEPGNILHNDWHFALLEADLNSSGHHLGGCALVWDDLKELHLIDGRKVVHADYVLGAL